MNNKKNLLKYIFGGAFVALITAAIVLLIVCMQNAIGNNLLAQQSSNLLESTRYALQNSEQQRFMVETVTEKEWQARVDCVAAVYCIYEEEVEGELREVYEEYAASLVDYDEAIDFFAVNEDKEIFLSTNPDLYGQKLDVYSFYPDINFKVYSSECDQIEDYAIFIICDGDVMAEKVDAVTANQTCFMAADEEFESVFSFAINRDDGIIYYLNVNGEDYSGMNYAEAGIPVKIFTEDELEECSIFDGEYTVKAEDFDSEIYGNLRICTAFKRDQTRYLQLVNWTIYMTVLACILVGCYCLFLRQDNKSSRGQKLGMALRLEAIALVFIMGVTLLTQTLNGLSISKSDLSRDLEALSKTVSEDNEIDALQKEYISEMTVETVEVMSLMFSTICSDLQGYDEIPHIYYDDDANYVREPITDLYGHPLKSFENSDPLVTLSGAYLGADMQVINRDGYTIASSGRSWHYKLMDEEEEFRNAIYDVIDGKSGPYVNVSYDENGISNGITIALQTSLYTQDIDGETIYCDEEDYELLPGEVDMQNAAILVNIKDKDFSLEDSEVRAESIVKQFEIMTGYDFNLYEDEEQLEHIQENGSINRFKREGGTRYFIYEAAMDELGKVVSVYMPTDDVFYFRGFATLFYTVSTAIVLFVMALLLTGLKPYESGEEREAVEFNQYTKISYIPWKKRSPREKTRTLFKILMLAAVLALAAEIFAIGKSRDDSSVIYYLMSGEWERGINFYSMLALGICIFSALSIYLIVSEIIAIISSRREIYEQIRFKAVRSIIGIVLFCGALLISLYLFGMDVKGMFASAGIMAAVIAYASKDSIANFVDTLSLIFSDKVRIGELVTIGSFTGFVTDIGFKNTKLRSYGGDIKYIQNSSFKDFVNTSRENSDVIVEFQLDINQDPETIEQVINNAIPKISAEIPHLKAPIKYLGINATSSDAMTVMLWASCHETAKGGIRRKMIAEFIKVFRENGVRFAYPKLEYWERE